MSRSLPKVVQVGFNKCATRSLAELFERSGHRAAHHKFKSILGKNRNIAEMIRGNIAAGHRMFHGFEDYVLYGDLMSQTQTETYEVFKDFRRVLADYPGTILLLTYRDRENWIRSRLKHGHGTFQKQVMAVNGFSTQQDCIDFWRHDWDTHLADLRSFMQEKPGQLVQYNTDTQPIEDLVAALPAYELDAKQWGDVGRSRGRRLGAVSKYLRRKNAERKVSR